MSHHHDHRHQKNESFNQAFVIGIILNTAFIIAEVIYGLYANSLSLLADAGHNLGDVLGLFMAWGAFILAKRLPSARYTYGLQSATILAALSNALILLGTCIWIGWEAIQRFYQLVPVKSATVMIVAAVGILVNGFTAMLFMAGRKKDLNIRGAFLHLAADAVISLGVVITGALILKPGYLWLDPLVSVIISAIIIFGTWELLHDALALSLHATPKHISTNEVRAFLEKLQGVEAVHDLHIWAMSTKSVALSVHLLMPCGHPGDVFITQITEELMSRFGISHTTIQIEMGDGVIECRCATEKEV